MLSTENMETYVDWCENYSFTDLSTLEEDLLALECLQEVLAIDGASISATELDDKVKIKIIKVGEADSNWPDFIDDATMYMDILL
jgi:hypothetical protein